MKHLRTVLALVLALAMALRQKSVATNLLTSVSIGCIVHALLLEIVDSREVRARQDPGQLRESVDGVRINQILSCINGNLFNGISAGKVAAALGLGERQASRECVRLFGCSLNQLIVRIRLKEICAMLINTRFSIADIAEAAGFSSPYAFSRHFSHYAGVTPSAYRKNYEIKGRKPGFRE